MTPELVDFVKREEALRLEPYCDVVGIPTIGWGHRIPAITQLEAEGLLDQDLGKAERAALVLCPNLATEPRRLAALTDLCFNVGATALAGSGVVRCLRAGDWTGAAIRFRKWDHAKVNGVLIELAGLKRRRAMGAQWIEQGDRL